jgi:hypothetical protein
MPRYGTYEQREACDIFHAADEIVEKFRVSTMEEMHSNIGYYKEILEISKNMLGACEKIIYDEEELNEILEDYPDFENLAFDLCEYEYQGCTWIYKYEIEEFVDILSQKMTEYKKFLTDITVNAGVALALLRLQ